MVNSVDLSLELRKRVTHNFSSLRTRPLEYKRRLVSQVRVDFHLRICVD